MNDYSRIIYPERAEYFSDESVFKGYRIFLNHWRDATSKLRTSFEVLRTRRFSTGLMVYGKQGCGKSMLAQKLDEDFKQTKQALIGASYDPDNIWHQVCAGGNASDLNDNIRTATAATAIIKVESRKEWTQDAQKIVEANRDRSCIVIADNCERDYFIKGLLNISDEAYLAHGRTEAALRAAAHKFVELARSTLRGCLFILFTNDEELALIFTKHVEEQHAGLLAHLQLNMPPDVEKETIVRVNVNRLNNFSYWLCIDRAGPQEKSAVWRTLQGAETFPAAFNAVDNAIRSSTRTREGRPARKCILNAFVFTNSTFSAGSQHPPGTASLEKKEIFRGNNFHVDMYTSGWGSLFGDTRECQMLASEWNLRIIIAGDCAVSALLASHPLAKRLIDEATIYHGPGTHESTKDAYIKELTEIDTHLTMEFPAPDNSGFWSKGGVRSHDYEAKLKTLYPGYNTKSGGFMNARPDLVLEKYTACSVLLSDKDDSGAITNLIRRDAASVEFTAIRDYSWDKLATYLLNHKLSNYIATTQEQ